jgi:hypothetical protein
VSGREFTAQDTAGAPPAVIVSGAMARRYWPGEEAVGKRLYRGEVAGVVRNSKGKGFTKKPRPAIYVPLLQNVPPHVRTATESQTLLAAFCPRSAIAHAMLPILQPSGPLAEQKDGSLYTERLGGAPQQLKFAEPGLFLRRIPSLELLPPSRGLAILPSRHSGRLLTAPPHINGKSYTSK